eukprot:CAMPEP_0181204512 /NCGR_PEP_ID=MMETSP1096-20121128/19979_1 /TAXON_ID=156174 ORGANISM="Chrysochromulina ericina, Strain CCMP281" /NCGR_SAMPLE_ID=MMETSP1096 /ASSEMBLY_ACC=CAM_ASM_000453 /LENGTH=191 /DNA_ID=CAMNT_0023295225 /DNA_START=400 /DNA_END=976 /DNA_ORIENTATION=-
MRCEDSCGNVTGMVSSDSPFPLLRGKSISSGPEILSVITTVLDFVPAPPTWVIGTARAAWIAHLMRSSGTSSNSASGRARTSHFKANAWRHCTTTAQHLEQSCTPPSDGNATSPPHSSRILVSASSVWMYSLSAPSVRRRSDLSSLVPSPAAGDVAGGALDVASTHVETVMEASHDATVMVLVEDAVVGVS